jgi:hypothetical protein
LNLSTESWSETSVSDALGVYALEAFKQDIFDAFHLQIVSGFFQIAPLLMQALVQILKAVEYPSQWFCVVSPKVE